VQKQSPLAKPDARTVWQPSVVAFAPFQVDHGVQRYGAKIDRTQITSKSKEAGRLLRCTSNQSSELCASCTVLITTAFSRVEVGHDVQKEHARTHLFGKRDSLYGGLP